MAYDNTNKGTIAKNARKEQDTHPDIAGSLNVDGIDYWINGWLKKNGKDGSAFYSLSVKPKEARRDADTRQQTHAVAPHPRRAAPDDRPTSYDRDDARTGFARDLDDDLPF